MIISGIVQKGKGEARLFGTPTANIYTTENIICGIYAGYLTVDNIKYKSCIYVSIENNKYKIEAYAIDKEFDLYNKNITVEIIKLIRQNIIFESLEELKKQILKDVKDCQQALINCL